MLELRIMLHKGFSNFRCSLKTKIVFSSFYILHQPSVLDIVGTQ